MKNWDKTKEDEQFLSFLNSCFEFLTKVRGDGFLYNDGTTLGQDYVRDSVQILLSQFQQAQSNLLAFYKFQDNDVVTLAMCARYMLECYLTLNWIVISEPHRRSRATKFMKQGDDFITYYDLAKVKDRPRNVKSRLPRFSKMIDLTAFEEFRYSYNLLSYLSHPTTAYPAFWMIERAKYLNYYTINMSCFLSIWILGVVNEIYPLPRTLKKEAESIAKQLREFGEKFAEAHNQPPVKT